MKNRNLYQRSAHKGLDLILADLRLNTGSYCQIIRIKVAIMQECTRSVVRMTCDVSAISSVQQSHSFISFSEIFLRSFRPAEDNPEEANKIIGDLKTQAMRKD